MKKSLVRFLLLVSTFILAQPLAKGATIAENAATFGGSSYLRSAIITRPAFSTSALTYELWFNADGPGVLVNEVDQFSPAAWDYSFLEVRKDRMLLAGLPGLPTIHAGKIEFGRWYHVAIRYTPATGDLDLFLDGVKVATGHGTRAVPWGAGRTTFMSLGRGGPSNLMSVAGAQLTLTETSGNASLTFSETGQAYVLERAGVPQESGAYAATYTGATRTWDVTLTPTGGGTLAALRLSFTSATRGQFTLTRAGAPDASGPMTLASDLTIGAGFRGQIDEVRMWTEALADETIVSSRRIRLPNGDSRLFAMWSLDAIQGTAEGFPTTPDRSGRANPALIVGSIAFTPSGADLIPDQRPQAKTGDAIVGTTAVTIAGTATSSVAGIAYFRFGRGGELDKSSLVQPIAAGTNEVQTILEGLASLGSYSYSLIVSNEFGVSQGTTRTFTAPDLRPVATTGPAVDSAGSSTLLTGSATVVIPSVAYFVWGEGQATNKTPDMLLSVGASPVEFALQDLVGDRDYRFALVVTNAAGISTGDIRTFTKIPPSVALQAATFTGSGYLRSQRNTQQFFSDAAFTFELWFKADAAGALINEVHQFSEPLWDHTILEVNADRRLIASVPGVSAITGPVIEFGTWHHAAVRYNSAKQELDLFLDGVKASAAKGIRQLPTAGNTTFMTFGRNTPGKPRLRGQIDEVRMWKTALSDAEIAGNRRVKFANSDPRLFAMWSLDVISGSSEGFPTTPDRSANNNPALLVGSVTIAPSGADLISDRRPSAATQEATVGAVSVSLNGSVTSSAPATVYFRFGRNGILDQTSPPQLISVATNGAPVAALLQGLASLAEYTYALVASNQFGVSQGVARGFVAPDIRPLANTGLVQDDGVNVALNGSATTPIPGVAYFIWGETEMTNQTSAVEAPVGTSAVQATLAGLIADRTYRYALVVTNEGGVATGETRTFTKAAPSVSLLAASLAGSGYLRSQHITRQFFSDAALTYELWFKADAPGVLINEAHQFSVSLWDFSLLEIDSQRRVVAGVPGVPEIVGPMIEFGTWHHAAIRYNAITKDLDLFLDGAKVGTSRGVRALPWESGHTVFMTIGRGFGGRPSLRGQVDEIRMWRTPLTDTEIATNRLVKLANPDGRLFAMWSVDVIQGSSEGYPTTPDRSGNNNPALLVGSVTLAPSGAYLVGDRRPSAVTGVADVTGYNVVLRGVATSATGGSAFFRYGRGDLAQSSAVFPINPGNGASVQANVGPLEPGTYEYVLVATNEFGIFEGAVRSFTIEDLRPVVTTGAFEDALGNLGVLKGSVSTPVPGISHFIWGQDVLNMRTADIQLSGGTPVSVEALLNELAPGETYRYALVASNQYGLRIGNTNIFTKLGFAGSAVKLSGSSYIRTTNDQKPFFPDETITAEVWVKPSKAGVVMAEFDRLNPTALDSSVVEILTSGNVVAGFPGLATISIGIVQMNEWNHIAIRYDKSTQRLEGWVNGVKSPNTSTGDRIAGWELGRQVVYTFAKSAIDRIGTGEHLEGEFDEIRLWSSSRTDAEITQNYSRKLFGTESGMVAYYRFDERITTVTDHSRHNNTGQIVNFSTATFVTSSAPVKVDYKPITLSQDGSLRVQFTGIAGREMRLRSTSDFVTWTEGPVVIVDQLGVATFVIQRGPPGQAVQFYSGRNL